MNTATEPLKVFLACAAGGAIGSLTALESDPRFWWIGLFAGALIGYVAYEFGTVVRAVRAAARACFRVRIPMITTHALAATAAAMVAATSTTALLAWGFRSLAVHLVEQNPGDELVGFLCFFTFGISTVVFGFGSLIIPAMLITLACENIGRDGDVTPGFIKEQWTCAAITNPLSAAIIASVGLSVLAGKHLPRFLEWLFATAIPGAIGAALVAVGAVCYFVRTVFLAIHSQLRLLCAVDAAIGAVAGFACGSVLAGALAGGIFGVLNFELVSKRWLKLARAKA